MPTITELHKDGRRILFLRSLFCEASAPGISMAKRRTTRSTFWTGALCGAAAACIAGQLLRLGRPHLTLIRGKNAKWQRSFAFHSAAMPAVAIHLPWHLTAADHVLVSSAAAALPAE